MPELVTLKAAAGELNVSPATIYRAVKEGNLPVIRVGKRYLVNRETLLQDLTRKAERELATAAAGGAR